MDCKEIVASLIQASSNVTSTPESWAAQDAAFAGLTGLGASEVIDELGFWFDVITEGLDVETLAASARRQLPPAYMDIADAVQTRDTMALMRATGGNDPNLAVPALVMLIVALKDAKAQLLS